MKHSQRVALKERDKKKATAADVTQAMKRAQGQLGNFGDATGTFDDLMGNLELGTASALSQSDRGNWWKGAFGEAGLAAPKVEDIYQNLAEAAQKKAKNAALSPTDPRMMNRTRRTIRRRRRLRTLRGTAIITKTIC